MKKILLSAVISGIALASFAQKPAEKKVEKKPKPFYLTPVASTGTGNASQNIDAPGSGITTPKPKSIITHNIGMNFGYLHNKLRFEAGLQYGSSGYKYLEKALPGAQKNSSISVTYSHLSIPIQVGYEVQLNKEVKMIPKLGLLTSYNIGATEKQFLQGSQPSKRDMSSSVFNDNYNKISLWTTAAVHFEYAVGPRVGVFAGPSFQYMVSDFLKMPPGGTFDPTQRNYNLHIDLGATFRLDPIEKKKRRR